MRDLEDYIAKRNFAQTSEPDSGVKSGGVAPRFSFQKHDATRLHWDLRLEHDGVLLSWAVTRGPSLYPKDKRLAVRTEDHPVGPGLHGTDVNRDIADVQQPLRPVAAAAEQQQAQRFSTAPTALCKRKEKARRPSELSEHPASLGALARNDGKEEDS